MEELRNKAIRLGATGFGSSDKPSKRFFVEYKGKRIDFGSDSRNTFFDIKDKDKRKNWYARHSTNINKKTGKKFINEKTSPLYWAYRILWD
tara:strand:+ start:638 stop:910 length:273 start_codon:yes stop_codon:yes gene_type:complete